MCIDLLLHTQKFFLKYQEVRPDIRMAHRSPSPEERTFQLIMEEMPSQRSRFWLRTLPSVRCQFGRCPYASDVVLDIPGSSLVRSTGLRSIGCNPTCAALVPWKRPHSEMIDVPRQNVVANALFLAFLACGGNSNSFLVEFGQGGIGLIGRDLVLFCLI